MADYKHLAPKELEDNLFSRIGDEWMLITAKNPETGKFNTMTASWGGAGILWNKPVVFIFIRSQRYTFEFTEASDEVTLSFFDSAYKPALALCGRVSGRDHDKITEAGLTPVEDGGYVSFAEAHLIIKAKKLYGDFLKEACFLDAEILKEDYPKKDYHKMYVCEITDILKK